MKLASSAVGLLGGTGTHPSAYSLARARLGAQLMRGRRVAAMRIVTPTLLAVLFLCAADPLSGQVASGPAPFCPIDSVAQGWRDSLGFHEYTGLCLETPAGRRRLIALWYGSGPTPGFLAL